MRIIITSLFLCFVLWGSAAAPVAAQSAPDADAITRDQVNAVARELWCPLCSNVRLDSCELQACEQMRDEIGLKLAAGESKDVIKAYFVEQYGPQVMGEPPLTGFNLLAWLLPVAALMAGLGFLLWRGYLIWGKAAPAQSASRSVSSGSPPHAPAPTGPALPEDPYQKQLADQLRQIDG